jgi:uncharacterized protein YkwD
MPSTAYRFLGIVLTTLVLAAPARAATCPDTALTPTPANLGRVQASLVCLHNEVRARAGLRPLVPDTRLERAAGEHSRDMVARRYFAHDAPDGRSFADRIIGAGYTDRDQRWWLGENLAWGRDARATPAAIMDAWMRSPGHRRNILKPLYRDVGLAVTLGAPTGGPDAITVDAEFGRRGTYRRSQKQ